MIKEYQVASVVSWLYYPQGVSEPGQLWQFNINEYCGDFAEHVAENPQASGC